MPGTVVRSVVLGGPFSSSTDDAEADAEGARRALKRRALARKLQATSPPSSKQIDGGRSTMKQKREGAELALISYGWRHAEFSIVRGFRRQRADQTIARTTFLANRGIHMAAGDTDSTG